MTKCIKQYIVVKSQYVLHILQFIGIHFLHIVTTITNSMFDCYFYFVCYFVVDFLLLFIFCKASPPGETA